MRLLEAGEVAGLRGYKQCPSADGTVEIGHDVVTARRGQRPATRAVAAMVAQAGADRRISRLGAETTADNLASRRVLEKNGFLRVGTRTDPEEGPLIL
ncbi:MAG: GCN5-related N-acetyltransferase [Rhodospirillales bacterium]|nr:GCN5-related N-acetyltransferase [Rhodospirillales bacterium]